MPSTKSNNKIIKSKYETEKDYQRRQMLISRISPKDNKSLQSAVLTSFIANNILNLHCVYPEKLQKRVQQTIKNIL
tara:strand:- start:469 stop:696 length:228 start_codon:yes stop_codon:yes gene_type:complete